MSGPAPVEYINPIQFIIVREMATGTERYYVARAEDDDERVVPVYEIKSWFTDIYSAFDYVQMLKDKEDA